MLENPGIHYHSNFSGFASPPSPKARKFPPLTPQSFPTEDNHVLEFHGDPASPKLDSQTRLFPHEGNSCRASRLLTHDSIPRPFVPERFVNVHT